MGVSIRIGKEDITPGWRSMMYGLLVDNFQCIYTERGVVEFYFTKKDIRCLDIVSMKQLKGEEDEPFDYCKEVFDSFQTIIKRLRKRKSDRPLIVRCVH